MIITMLLLFYSFLFIGLVMPEPIIININTRGANTSLDFSGSIEDLITEKDIEAFGITDDTLKLAIEAIMGAKPNEVSLGTWSDIYKSYHWTPVKRTLTPIKAEVLKIFSKPVIISRQKFNNTLFKSANFRAEISSTITDTISSTWIEHNTWSNGTNLAVNLNFFSLSGDFSNSYTWGVDTVKGRSVSVGSSSSVSMDLSPGEEVEAVLSATRRITNIQVDYATSLSGDVACKFSWLHSGRTFWRQDVNMVLATAGIPFQIYSRQRLRVESYSEATVTLVNATSNDMLIRRPAVFGM